VPLKEFTGKLAPLEPEGAFQEYKGGNLLPLDEEFREYKGGKLLPLEEAPKVDEDSSDFMRGFKNILPQIQETVGGARVLAGKSLGDKEMIRAGAEQMKAGQAKQVSRETDEFTTAWEKGIGTVLTDWLPYQMGAGVGSLAETIASMGVGAVAGMGVGSIPGAVTGAVGKSLLKKEIKEKAAEILKEGGENAQERMEAYLQKEAKRALRKIGAEAGIIAQAGTHGAGEVTSRAVQELENKGLTAEDLDVGRVAPAAVVHAVADFVSDKIALGALKGLSGTSSKNLVLDVAKAVGTTGTKELVPEEIQAIAERYGAQLSLADAEALKEYVNTAAAAYGMSVVPGGVGGVRTYYADKAEDKTAKAQQALENKAFFKGMDRTEVDDPAAQVDPELEAALRPVTLDDEQAPAAATDTSTQAPNQPTAVPGETPSIPEPVTEEGVALEQKIASMKEDYRRRQAEIDSGTLNPKAAENKRAANARLADEIFDLEGQLLAGTQPPAQPPATLVAQPLAEEIPDVSGQADTGATGVGVEVPSGPQAEGAPAVPAGAEPAGVVSGALPAAGVEGRAKAQSAALVQPPATPVAPPEEPKLSRKALEYLKEPSFYGGQANLEQFREGVRQELYASDFVRELQAQGLTNKQISDRVRSEVDRREKEFKIKAPSEVLAPTTVEQGVRFAGMEQAFDDFDTIDLTALAEAEKKLAAEKGVESLRELLTEKELVDFYKQFVRPFDSFSDAEGKQFFKNEGGWDSRKRQASRRGAFVSELPPAQQKQIEQLKDQAFKYAVMSYITRSDTRVTSRATEAKRAKALAKRQLEGAKEQAAQTEAVREEIKEKLGTDQAAAERRQESRADRAAKFAEQTAEERSARRAAARPKIEGAVNKTGSLKDVLRALVADLRRPDVDLSSTVIADSLLQIVENLKINASIQFGTLPQTVDGQFDPETNTITLQGENGRYIGNRSLSEVVLHEIAHYLTDHVIDNREAFIKSISGEKKRNEVRAALNRLDNNYRLAKTKLGKDFNISTMKEFIAEAFSNPQFQVALAKLPTREAYQPRSNLFSRIVNNIAVVLNLTDNKDGKVLKDTLEDIAQIISLPTAKIRGVGVSFSTPLDEDEGKLPKPREGGLGENLDEYETKETEAPKTVKFVQDMFSSTAPWKVMAHYFQNDRYFAKAWEESMDMAGKIYFDGVKKLNNIYTQITLSTGNAKNFYQGMIKPLHEKLNADINVLARELGKDVRTTIHIMHQLMEALHEPERRHVKYILTVPLSTKKNLNGGTLSAADRREQIVNLLDTKKLTEPQAQQLRAELDNLVAKYTDPFGFSPRGTSLKAGQTYTAEQISAVTNENSPMYNVLGVSQEAIAKRIDQYNNSPNKAEFDAVLNTLKELNKVTEDLSKYSNYWSDFVSNRVAFYGFKNYAPFKGKAEFDKHSEVDEYLDFDDRRMGAELQEAAFAFEGRISIADNPVLQTVSDAVRASMRAGRKDLTLSIKNAVNQGLIAGKVSKNPIKFEDRRDPELLKKLKGGKNIFHYNADGTIDIIRVDDKKLLESIRRTYKDTNTLVDLANSLTSTLGKMHTRWNYNFPPLNFVRDAITNTWAMGAEFGPKTAARMAGEISARVVLGNALRKSFGVARQYEDGNLKELVARAEKDPIIRDMVEYLQEGGMVSYLQGLSIKSNFEELLKSVSRDGVMGKVDDINKFMDIYINMFELASRSSAYAVVKQEYQSRGLSEAESRTRAAAYVKNLANFEQVGAWGKNLGAFYMFFRPAATGAVRAIEAAAPAIPGSMERAERGLPPEIYNSPEALEAWRDSYRKLQKNSRIMLSALSGIGYLTYVLASMLAPDDDLGRNEVLNDNMEQWTRFARFHVPKEAFGGLVKEDQVLQIPWGFGLGAFASAAAQLASVVYGKESLNSALSNIVMQIAFDSFLPIPVSRMKFQDNPTAYVVDSLTPSAFRPLVEFVMNKNGLGQDIYNDSNRRMGDAYLGGDRIPEIYKDAAASLAEYHGVFGEMGQFDISPNTLYFFSNSYVDGLGRVVELAYGAIDLTKGAKEFSPKNDIPLFGSFFGSKSSIDARQFAEGEKRIKELERRVNLFEANPEKNAEYQSLYPLHSAVVDYYNQEYAQRLKSLQSIAKDIRMDQDLSNKNRSEMLRENKYLQDIVKNDMLENIKMYGVLD
jgi:hypothetical protein